MKNNSEYLIGGSMILNIRYINQCYTSADSVQVNFPDAYNLFTCNMCMKMFIIIMLAITQIHIHSILIITFDNGEISCKYDALIHVLLSLLIIDIIQ